jgi:hypothetical protein
VSSKIGISSIEADPLNISTDRVYVLLLKALVDHDKFTPHSNQIVFFGDIA